MQGQPYGTNDFAMMIPAGWKRQSVFSFIGPVVDDIQQSVVLTQDTLEADVALETYVDDQVAQLKGELRKFKLKERATLEVRGVETPLIRYQWKPQKTKAVAQVQVFFLKFPLAWTLTGTSAVGAADAFWPMFQEVAQSFINRLPGD